ncbi:MAG: hypothetical protein OXH52_14190 [Gammaproteobacteria bacterium]|nr:hypothetical protein [Gammaproteobacteria bacterium]
MGRSSVAALVRGAASTKVFDQHGVDQKNPVLSLPDDDGWAAA